MDILSLFWNIWSNPQTKSFQVLQYLLAMAPATSLTWAAHVRIIFQLYKLPDPLVLLNSPLWSKEIWKNHFKILVLSHHEANLRRRALQNYKLKYFNVQTIGLMSKAHPILSWVMTTQDVVIVRPHIKMLAGDYLCGAHLSHDRGLDPQCKLCKSLSGSQASPEDIEHLLLKCRATSDIRQSKLPNLLNAVAQYYPYNTLLISPATDQLLQFILDCTSLNLTPDTRIDSNNPGFTSITRLCSDFIFAIHRDRTKQMKALGLLHSKV